MQITRHGNMRNSSLEEPYPPNERFHQPGRTCFLLIAAIMIFCSSSYAQKIVDKVVAIPKKVNITVGSPIDNEATRKVLEVIDRIPGLTYTIHRYNEKF